MKAVVQRVSSASVQVNGEIVGRIGKGLLTLLGVAVGDAEEQIEKMIQKIVELRIFSDEQGKMNLSLKDIGGSHLLVSQFTLLGDCSKGRRPFFNAAEKPDRAKELFELSIKKSRDFGVHTESGVFAAHMEVELLNDGPVTIILES